MEKNVHNIDAFALSTLSFTRKLFDTYQLFDQNYTSEAEN